MSVNQRLTTLVQEVKLMSAEDLYETYGIEITENNGVYDPVINKTFKTIAEWATAYLEEFDDQNYGAFQKKSGKHHFDDEYY